MKIAKLKALPTYRMENSEPEQAQFEYIECQHENIGVRFPPVIRNVMDFYDRGCWEYCKDCGERLRTLNNS